MGGKNMKWQKKLTKKELAHVKEWAGGTLAGLKRTREFHRADLAAHPDGPEPCWDCKIIARKLGLE
jgi:hypothetical protein